MTEGAPEDTVSPDSKKPKTTRKRAASKPKSEFSEDGGTKTDNSSSASAESQEEPNAQAEEIMEACECEFLPDAEDAAIQSAESTASEPPSLEAESADTSLESKESSDDITEAANTPTSDESADTEIDTYTYVSDDTDSEDAEIDGQISFFSISASGFDDELVKGTPINIKAPAEKVIDEERIVPPDELFAKIESDETRDEPDIEDAPFPEEEVVEELCDEKSAEADEGDDEDPQYRLTDFDIKPEKHDSAQQKYDPKKPRKIDGRFDLIELFVFTLLAVMIITSFFFKHSVVKGESMENTLHDGEHLIISSFMYTPKRGDVIVCEDHTAEISTPIVKRIIAVGGDRIRIEKNGEVYVNEKLINESDYVFIDNFAKPYEYKPLDIIVPKGQLFVMGDHRNNSTDSRDMVKLGTISEDAVLGKVLIRFYPFDKFGTID